MASPNQLSFLPEDYLERKARRRSNIVCAGLFVVVMAAIGSAFTLSDRGLKDLQQRLAAVDAECTLAAQRIQAAQEIKQKQARMTRQAELADSLVERTLRSTILAEFTNARPQGGVSLLDLALDSKVRAPKVVPGAVAKTAFEQKKAARAAATAEQSAPAGPKVYDVFLKLTGVAENDVQVAQFIGRLNASPLFNDVNLVISDEFQASGSSGQKSGDKLRRFQVEMKLNPNAEAQPAPDTKTAAVELQ